MAGLISGTFMAKSLKSNLKYNIWKADRYLKDYVVDREVCFKELKRTKIRELASYAEIFQVIGSDIYLVFDRKKGWVWLFITRGYHQDIKSIEEVDGCNLLTLPNAKNLIYAFDIVDRIENNRRLVLKK